MYVSAVHLAPMTRSSICPPSAAQPALRSLLPSLFPDFSPMEQRPSHYSPNVRRKIKKLSGDGPLPRLPRVVPHAVCLAYKPPLSVISLLNNGANYCAPAGCVNIRRGFNLGVVHLVHTVHV